jgi:hypothetical protein
MERQATTLGCAGACLRASVCAAFTWEPSKVCCILIIFMKLKTHHHNLDTKQNLNISCKEKIAFKILSAKDLDGRETFNDVKCRIRKFVLKNE